MGSQILIMSSSLLLLVLLGFTAAAAAVPPGGSIHDILREYGFPPGVIPNVSVTSYYFAPNGSFAIYLNDTCYVETLRKLYLLRFDTEITGNITYGDINGLKGFHGRPGPVVWNDVDRIRVINTGSTVAFYVGENSITANTSVFDTIQTCLDNPASSSQLLIPKVRGLELTA